MEQKDTKTALDKAKQDEYFAFFDEVAACWPPMALKLQKLKKMPLKVEFIINKKYYKDIITKSVSL
jgi:hypothetical protein